jgi:hypothetical protein
MSVRDSPGNDIHSNPVEHRPNGFEISAWRIVESLDAGIWDAGDVVCGVLDRLVKDQARVRVDERTEEAPGAARMPQLVLAPSILRRKQIGDCIKLFEQIALLLIMESIEWHGAIPFPERRPSGGFRPPLPPSLAPAARRVGRV